ncbi:hypothetical protein G7046_g7305 [Stylonectria norvegica]|nr:hypothetical protein G7046_g7305 [Stylonectria norvegica]
MSSPAAEMTTHEHASKSPVPVDLPEAAERSASTEPAKEQDPDQDLDSADEGEASDTASNSAEASGDAEADSEDAPPLPNEPSPEGPPLPQAPVPGVPPLPTEPLPQPEDDGWDCLWDQAAQSWYFANRFTGKTQWDNPRVPTDAAPATIPAAPGTQPSVPLPPTSDKPAAGGYNPAIHGDYDPNAWYAQGGTEEGHTASASVAPGDPSDAYGATATFNRFTGQFQTSEMGPERHNDEAKSKRQMNAFFDVDAAANSHDGRSLKAERSGKKPSKAELKAFKEKRKARKEEKRRAWLRD